MKIGIYGSPQHPAAAALAAGAGRVGFSPAWREQRKAFTEDQVEDFPLVVVVDGLRRPQDSVHRTYVSRGVPVLLLEYGYLRRGGSSYQKSAQCAPAGGEYFRLAVNRLNWVPEGPLPGDRFAALGLRVTLEGPTGGNVVVCGQVPDDSAHGLSRAQLEQEYSAIARSVRMYTRSPIVFRPHPADGGWQHISGPFNAVLSPLLTTLDTCLRDALAVVTVNSNVGHEALLAGVPVFCRPCYGAAYEELAETDLSRLTHPEPPSSLRRQEYFNRLAYGQWTAGELETGEPLRFLQGRGLIPGG